MYNQKQLIEKLKTLQGNKSLNNFAKELDIDSSTLSRIINYNRTTPPTPDILKKIANHSKGFITYIELMYICGYITDENIPELEILLFKLKNLTVLESNIQALLNNLNSSLTDKEKEIAIFYSSDTLNKLSNYKNITYEVLAQQVLDKLEAIKDIDVNKTYGYYILNVASKLDSINYNISDDTNAKINVSGLSDDDIEYLEMQISYLKKKNLTNKK